jgi:hypothetical protein
MQTQSLPDTPVLHPIAVDTRPGVKLRQYVDLVAGLAYGQQARNPRQTKRSA